MERKIYLYLTDSGTFPGWLVKQVTRYPYSHAMLSLHGDGKELHSFGRRSVHNFLNGGFVTENWDGPFFTHFSKTRCAVYELTLTQAQHTAVCRELETFIARREQFRYDFAGCFLRFWGNGTVFAHRYTCSHFVAEVLQQAQICQFPRGAAFVRPADLSRIPNIRKRYEGQLQKLPQFYQEEQQNV